MVLVSLRCLGGNGIISKGSRMMTMMTIMDDDDDDEGGGVMSPVGVYQGA